MNGQLLRLIAVTFISVLVAGGCAGVKTFPNTLQGGETASMGIGWKKHFSRKDITITLTPASGSPVTYTAGDPEIRAVINLYPDLVSSLMISQELGYAITNSARTYSNQINNNFTNGDTDYWQTVVFFDVPATLSGLTTVDMSNSQGETATSTVNVLPATGTSDAFEAEAGAGPLDSNHLLAMERLDHYVVSFSGGAQIPDAIQLDIDYSTLIGYLVNTRGDLKSMHWRDTGSGYKVILMTAGLPLTTMHDYKFYVAIGSGLNSLTTLAVTPGSVKAYDANGVQITGVTASVALERGAAGLF